MATKLRNLELEIKHFNSIKKWLPGFNDWNQETLEAIASLGGLQVSTLAEHALANLMGTFVVSEDTHDLANGFDAKIATVRHHSYNQDYGAPVTNIHNKTGGLIVHVYERLLDKTYLFKIPRSAYEHISKTSNIEIPFNLDGTPKRSNKWWSYNIEEKSLLKI